MYKIYDYFLDEELDSDTNYAEDVYDSLGNWTGWHVVMNDAAGLTGTRIATWEEGDLGLASFVGGSLDANILTVSRWMMPIAAMAAAVMLVAVMAAMTKVVRE